MLRHVARKAVADLRAVSKGAGFGTPRRGVLRPDRPGEQHHGLRSALALAVVPSQLLPGMSLGAARAGTDALASIAMGRVVRGGWGGVSRPLTSSTGESTGGGSNESPVDPPGGGGNENAASVGVDPQQLTAWITRCQNRKGLRELVEQRGESFNVIHVSAAWANLAEVRGGAGDKEAVMQRLQVMLRAKIQEAGPREIATLLLSMAKLKAGGQKGVDDELVGELKTRAMVTAGDFEPHHVGNLMKALVKMGIMDPDAGLVEAMQGRAMATAGDFKPQEVTDLVEALAKMGIRPHAGLVAALQGRATATAGDFKPRQVASLMSSLAKMDITRDTDLAEAMQARATASAVDFKPHQSANLLDALSKMGITPDAGLVAAMQADAPETVGGKMVKERTPDTPGGGGGQAKENTHADGDPGQLMRQLTRCPDKGGLLRLTLNPEP